MAWVYDHIEGVIAATVATTTAAGGGIGAMFKFVLKDRASVLSRIGKVETGLEDTMKSINGLATRLVDVEQTAREESQELKDQLERHSHQVREDFLRVHSRTDEVLRNVSELAGSVKIIANQHRSM